MLLGGPGGSLKVVFCRFLATSHSILASFGSSWSVSGRSQSVLSSNLVFLSLQVEVKNHFLSQLGAKVGPNLPSKSIFHRFCNSPNLDFCNTLQCFSIFQEIASKMLSETKNYPRCDSKWLPRASQEASKRPQERSKRPQELSMRPQEHPKIAKIAPSGSSPRPTRPTR